MAGYRGDRKVMCASCAVVSMALVVASGGWHAAAADEVTSNGTVLHGKITRLSAAGIVFEPEYGKGELAIPWENVEDVTSDEPFQILWGEDQETDAPLAGFDEGRLMVDTTTIDIASIKSGYRLGADGLSFNDRMRSYWRYWDGNFDVGLNVQQSTTDSTGFVVAFSSVRTKDPTRLILGAGYRYGTQKEKGEDKTRTLDQLVGLVRGEYDFTPRIYGFASGDATYDGIQELSIRGVPKIGAGYKLWEQKLDEARRNFLQVEAGGGWVYERYFGGDHNDFFAVAFGLLAGYYLPYGAHFDWRVDYLPAVDDFTGDYLLRTGAGLGVPLVDPISAKFSLLDEYDSTPASDAESNSLFLTFGLSVVW